MMIDKELLAGIRQGLLKWYDFSADSVILYMGEETDAIPDFLKSDGHKVICVSMEKMLSTEITEKIDYIISIADLEQHRQPCAFLQKWKEVLAPEGTLLLGMNNRLGIRYFCGDRDPYTKRVLDGVEDYQRVYADETAPFGGRMYSRTEIRDMLQRAGWGRSQFFSVLPDLAHPFFLFAEDYECKEDLEGRITPVYNDPSTLFLEEETLYRSLLDNGMFHAMANAYLVECTVAGALSDAKQATISCNRKHEDAFATIIHGNDTVEKRALYPEGVARLKKIAAASEDLAAHGLKVVSGRLDGNRYIMPYIHAETGQLYLKRLFRENREKFFEAIDQFKDCVLRSSEHVAGDADDGNGVMLRNGYIDLIPLNSFFVDGEFVFFDQEFCEQAYPANAILVRVVHSFYAQHPELIRSFPPAKFYKYYGLEQYIDKWKRYDREFITGLCQDELLDSYYQERTRNSSTVAENRSRMNYSAKEYQKRFISTFEHLGTRSLVVFGSGKIAERFIKMYGESYPVSLVVDNDEKKWGTELAGIEIRSPMMLSSLRKGTYYVVVCLKNCRPVMRQIEDMKVSPYCVFEPSRVYVRKSQPIVPRGEGEKKPYHVGYIAGVFDLFHIGHLNLLRRAKEQCDYLIVGIVTDFGVRVGKKVEPFVSFEERVEIVRSCRYVDEVVEIPADRPDTEDAWKMYRFDVQFSGSDYEHDARWLAKKAFLEEHGATMVFFPYTESTSSTRLKKLIEKKLL